MLDICKYHFPESVLKDAFFLTYDRMRRYGGIWHIERKPLFPACVVLESDDGHSILTERTFCNDTVNFNESMLQCMSKEEEQLLKSLCGELHHLGMSKGIIFNGMIKVTEGPLRGMEDRIYKIDRHKRQARILVKSGKLMDYVTAGLEIIEKS